MRSEHTLIMGSSDVGKTPLLREMHDRVNGVSILVNHNDAEGFGGRQVTTEPESIEAAVTSFTSWSQVRLQTKGEPEAATWKAIEVARTIYSREGVPCQIILDESQNVIREKGYSGPAENPAGWGLHEGKNAGIKMVLSTQDPMSWPNTPLRQARWWCWVGAPARSQQSWFDSSVASWIPRDELPATRFRYVVMHHHDDREITEETVVFEGRTNKNYG